MRRLISSALTQRHTRCIRRCLSSIDDSAPPSDVQEVTPPPPAHLPPAHLPPARAKQLRSTSRRFVFRYPGDNTADMTYTYMSGQHNPAWYNFFYPDMDVNQWQRKAMYERECEREMFARDPREFSMEQLGFSKEFTIPEQIIKIQAQQPTHFVLYHDLCEMWKRRQTMDVPYVNVGSYVEATLRSKWDLSRNVTYRGIVVEKRHQDLSAHFIIRQNLSHKFGHGVENYIHMYSPYLQSVKVLSYQVRDDPTGSLTSLRDLTRDQTDIPDSLPEPIFDQETKLEIPHFVPVRQDYAEKTDQKCYQRYSKHYRPRRADTLRNYKLWESKEGGKRHPMRNPRGNNDRA